jgi:beta-phosphoglucomutase-like phosphatase (HAD superfamily)
MTKPANLSFTPLGAIFDVDDTLLNNYPVKGGMGLHERARLFAIKELGQKHNIPELIETTEEQNKHVIRRATEHSVEGSIWQLFYELGLVKDRKIDHANPLLREMAARKHDLYEPILAEFGAPLPQAVEFVQAMYVLTDGKIAIASGAKRRDILVFLKVTGMDAYFLPERIFSRDDFERSKPDPEPFSLAFTSLGLSEDDRARVVAFEDDPKGIESAKAASLFTCAITTRFERGDLETMELAPDMIRDNYVAFAESFGITL